MSSPMFARTDRHRLLGLLLRIRALAYVIAGLPFLVFADLGTVVAVPGLFLLSAAALLPLLLRGDEDTGLRVSAAIDLAFAYVLWLRVPAAASVTLVLVLWTVAVVMFMTPPATGARFTGIAVGVELSKILVVLFAHGVIVAEHDDLVWLVIGRAVILVASYFVLRVVDQYLVALAAAAESGSDRYRRLMDAAPSAFLVCASDRIVYANPAASALLGFTTAELDDRSFSDLVAPEQRTMLSSVVRKAMEKLEPREIAGLTISGRGDEPKHVKATVTAIDFGQDIAVQMALSDVSAQMKAEQELAETRLNYRSFFERIPVALYRSKPNGEIIQVNRALCELLGARSEGELIGRDAKSFYIDIADRNDMTGMLDDRRIVVGFEARLRRLDGEVIWIRDTARLIETDIGDVYEGSMIDVTTRRNIEDELWSRAMQQEAAASIGQTALEMSDVDAVMRSVTETVGRVLQTDGAVVLERDRSGEFQMVGRSSGLSIRAAGVAELADRAHMTAAPVVLRTADEVRFAAPELAKAGISSAIAVMIPGTDIDFGTLSVLSTQERVFTSDDLNFLHSVASVLAAAVDRANAHRRLEELLRSKDDFVASVSHELRTPLTVVTGMAHELSDRWSELGEVELEEYTRLLVEQSQDMADLIEDLLVAARANIGNVTVVNEPMELDKQVEGVLASIAVPTGKTIVSHLEPGVVDADPIRVRQILRNLLTNAVRYGGPQIEVAMHSTSGTRRVEVIDNGAGIPEDDRERIFAAYERAHHAEGQPGSVGLGLHVSRTLATLMGGSLTYDYDGRSVFRLELTRDRAVEQELLVPAPQEDAVSAALRGSGSTRIGVDIGFVD